MKDRECRKDCPDRTATCHGSCERYARDRARLDAKRQEAAKNWPIYDYFRGKSGESTRRKLMQEKKGKKTY